MRTVIRVQLISGWRQTVVLDIYQAGLTRLTSDIESRFRATPVRRPLFVGHSASLQPILLEAAALCHPTRAKAWCRYSYPLPFERRSRPFAHLPIASRPIEL